MYAYLKEVFYENMLISVLCCVVHRQIHESQRSLTLEEKLAEPARVAYHLACPECGMLFNTWSSFKCHLLAVRVRAVQCSTLDALLLVSPLLLSDTDPVFITPVPIPSNRLVYPSPAPTLTLQVHLSLLNTGSH